MTNLAPLRKVVGALIGLGILAVFGLVVSLGVAGTAWQFRNPTGNATTFWTHLPDALAFRRLPQFQENP